MLTAEEERELVIKAQGGDQRAKTDLCKAFAPFIEKLAQYANTINNSLTLEDCRQGAYEGFLKGLDKFDIERGLRLATYLQSYVRESLQRTALNATNNAGLKTPNTKRVLKAVSNELRLNTAWKPSMHEIFQKAAQKLDLSPSMVERIYTHASIKTVSADAPVGGTEGSDTSFIELIASNDDHVEDYMERDEKAMRGKLLEQALLSLKPRSRDIIKRRYGLGSDQEEPETLEEVSQSYGLSRERIRQIELDSLQRMGKYLQNLSAGKIQNPSDTSTKPQRGFSPI